jgi:carbon-monoxide dehydrogenase large subunit
MFGKAVPRVEDRRLVTGQGLYVDDARWPAMAFATFVRSERAHANVVSVDCREALACFGVIDVITPASWPELAWEIPLRLGSTGGGGMPYDATAGGAPRPLLGTHLPRIGEPIAMVLSYNAYAGADAAALVAVEYEDLPVATWQGVLDGTAPQAHPGHDNCIAEMHHHVGDVDAALAGAEVRIDKEFNFQNLKSMALECRGAAASWDAASGVMTVRSTNQSPYGLRLAVAQVLGLPLEQVRVVAKDIGGSFGLKGRLAPEELMICLASYKLGIPVRWTETRLEHMLASDQNGRQRHRVKIGARADGTLLAMDLSLQKETGAFNHYDVLLPSNTVNHLLTQYKIPSVRVEARSYATNTAPGSPYRGAGRVEATFTMDRVLDAVARATGLDPLVVRERNIVQAADLPYRNGMIYRDGIPVEYRDTDFQQILRAAAERVDYWGWRETQKTLRAQGRMIGIGISSYVEGGGIGPSETAIVKVEPSGQVIVSIAVACMGQSHETTIAQVCAEVLGLPMDRVQVRGGDTQLLPMGFGSGASRVAVNAGNATHLAARKLLQKIKGFAAELFRCAPEDIECRDGLVGPAGAGADRLKLGDLAVRALRHPAMSRFDGPFLSATAAFYPRTVVWSSGVNIAVVEIDADSGRPNILRYVFAHDCGNPINPDVVDGQLCGGFTQGLGIAFGEEHRYDEHGQVLTGSLMNYYVARAADVPEIEIEHLCFPTPENPLGIKAVGESGPNAPPGALAAAVEDALEGAITIDRLPISWDAILLALAGREQAAREKALQEGAKGAGR